MADIEVTVYTTPTRTQIVEAGVVGPGGVDDGMTEQILSQLSTISSDLSEHTSATTNVHGVVDMEDLTTTGEAQALIDDSIEEIPPLGVADELSDYIEVETESTVDGPVTFIKDAGLVDALTGIGVGGSYRRVNNTNATLDPDDRVVGVANVSADRTITLPEAAAVSPTTPVIVFDETGDVNGVTKVFIAADTGAGDAMFNGISGVFGVLAQPFAWHRFWSNGVDSWYIEEASLGASVEYDDSDLAASPTIATGVARVAITEITTTRTVKLPPAKEVSPGFGILVFDASGDCSATAPIFVAIGSGSGDTMINGVSGAYATLIRPYAWTIMSSNGVDEWFSMEASDGTVAAYDDTALATTPTAPASTRQVRIVSMTADRTIHLPPANKVPPNRPIIVCDPGGNLGPHVLYVTPSGSDTIFPNIGLGYAAQISRPYSWAVFHSDGVSAWFDQELVASIDPLLAGDDASDAALATQKAIRDHVRNRFRQEFDDDVTVDPTTMYLAQVGNQTTDIDITVSLPAAADVPEGWELTITDESGTIGPTAASFAGPKVLIVPDGSDTIRNPFFPRATDVEELFSNYDTRKLRSNGVDQWFVINTGNRRPVIWWAHLRKVACPSGVWTPLPWMKVYVDNAEFHPDSAAAFANTVTVNTTVASGSNGATLPQSTINVTSTTGFLSAGWLEIIGPPGSGVGTVINYTGKTSTTFTGCNASPWAGISTGTLATSQVVNQATVDLNVTDTPYLYNAIYGASFEKNGCGMRAIRIAAEVFNGVYSFANGEEVPALFVDNQHLQMVMQPTGIWGNADPDVGGSVVQVFQDSGKTITTTNDGFTTPIIMQDYASGG